LVEATVSSDVFEDSSPIWPDGTYPHRFNFEINDEKHNVEFNDETFSSKVVDALRRSALAQGRPILVKEIGGSMPAEKISLRELAERTNFTQPELEEIESLLLDKKHIIFEGPPGAGKTYMAELFARYFTGNPLKGPHDERLKIVQFHQSYGYEDFVQGIRPETNKRGQIEYHVRSGIFKRLCRVAERIRDRSGRGKNVVIIIDEINRGNISRILGELLFLLEYRDKQVTLPYSRPEDPEFSIPTNVYLLGTMNTTDRSLAQIDYALRRRFYFYRMLPMVDGKAPVLERWLEQQDLPRDTRELILRLFVNLNRRIQLHLGEHFQVGHSYFMVPDIVSDAGRQRVWSRAVIPLLEEYFYNWRDRNKVLLEFQVGKLLSDQEQP
jgi:5-methylcytosine-specific restriction protein B